LAAAITTHNAGALRNLLAQGASPNRENLFGLSPVSAAAGSGDLKSLQTLLDNGGEIFDENWPNQPLHAAAAQGKTEVVSFLLDKGAPINTKDFYGRTPLILAIERGHSETALLLLKKGAHIGAKDRAGETALQVALKKGNSQIISALREVAGR
jgi:ankyrin repeat protein